MPRVVQPVAVLPGLHTVWRTRASARSSSRSGETEVGLWARSPGERRYLNGWHLGAHILETQAPFPLDPVAPAACVAIPSNPGAGPALKPD